MQRCFLAHCLRAACTQNIATTALLILELQPFPDRRCRTQLLITPSPPRDAPHCEHVSKGANAERTANLLLSGLRFCHLLFAPLRERLWQGGESCSPCFRSTFFSSEGNRVPAAQSDHQDRQDPHPSKLWHRSALCSTRQAQLGLISPFAYPVVQYQPLPEHFIY